MKIASGQIIDLESTGGTPGQESQKAIDFLKRNDCLYVRLRHGKYVYCIYPHTDLKEAVEEILRREAE